MSITQQSTYEIGIAPRKLIKFFLFWSCYSYILFTYRVLRILSAVYIVAAWLPGRPLVWEANVISIYLLLPSTANNIINCAGLIRTPPSDFPYRPLSHTILDLVFCQALLCTLCADKGRPSTESRKTHINYIICAKMMMPAT